MKKSFKKAGAAVLSMSMLLAMGAISMPVYADNPEDFPGQVKVVINGTNWEANQAAWNEQNSDGSQGTAHAANTYQYLSDVNTAEVNMYRVAELTQSGWAWDINFAAAVEEFYQGSATQKMSDFRKLLETKKGTDNQEHFTATSDELLQVASALERVTRDATGQPDSNLTPIANGTINVAAGQDYVYLPENVKAALDAATRDRIGYYLITTTTDEAGVVLQPVLVTLKNSNSGENPKTVNVKGYKISVDKTVDSIEDKDKHVALGTDDVVSTSGDTAIVAKDDIITYKIVTEIPKYDVNLNLTDSDVNMKDFTITDTPSAGIQVVSGNPKKPTNLKIHASEQAANEFLTEGTDYSVTGNADGSFVITITPSVYHTDTNSTGQKLEGQTLEITFDATVVDANFNTKDYTNATTADLTSIPAATQTKANKAVTDATAYDTAAATSITNTDDLAKLRTIYGLEASATLTADQIAQAKLALDTKGSGNYADLTKEEVEAEADKLATLKAAKTVVTAATGADGVAAADAKVKELLSEDNDLSDGQRVAGYLALQDLKATARGNDNTAAISYGNEYATGQGDGNDEDKATVYSVNLDLTKVTSDLKLKDGDTIDAADNNTWYDDETVETKVSGAVFELIKWDDNEATDRTKDKSLGYAVSDSNGKLWLLTSSTVNSKPTIATTIAKDAVAYFTDNGDGTYTQWTVNDPDIATNAAWRILTKGDYTLKEIYAPAGYKAISDLKITINAEDDGAATNPEYVGTFNNSTTSDTAGTTVLSKASGGKLDFEGLDGALEARIVDPKADTLPATGGIGTVLFTAGGISVVLIAGALFVMYMKKRNAEDEE